MKASTGNPDFPGSNPNKPLTACGMESCVDCPVRESLHCHFRLSDLAHFLTVAAPAFLVGGVGIYLFSPSFLIPWFVIILGFFGLVEIRVLCTHCPHYAEPGSTLTCWANYGSPKLWKYRPGPMSIVEQGILWGGFAVIWGYPPVFSVIGRRWFLLALYIAASAGFFTALRLFFCSRCINFACPLNRVMEEVRDEFPGRSPDIP